MRSVIIVFLFISTAGFSQNKVEKDLGSFDELKVFNGLYISLEKSDVSRIEITGKKSEEVVIRNVNGRLKLSMNFPETFGAAEVEIKMYYTDTLNVIDVNEGSNVKVLDTIKQHRIELKAQEGAGIDAVLDVKLLVGKSVTGGYLNLSGETESQDIDINTGGVFEGYGLISNQTYIFSTTGAYGKVYAKDILDAKVNFGGTIYFKGNPKEITKKKIIGGTIKSKD